MRFLIVSYYIGGINLKKVQGESDDFSYDP